MEDITLGLQLMVVGMITVFAILSIIIYGGKLLILIVNRLAPQEPKKQANDISKQHIDATTMVILQQTVSQLTAGKGCVASVKCI